MEVPYPCFDRDEAFNRHFDRVLKKEASLPVSACDHEFTEVETFDANRNERVCIHCGQVFLTEITEFDKLSGCLEGDEFLKVRYGPGTPVPLQSFLLPTLATNVKCRDKFVDTEHLQKTRKYTDIQRICQQFGIPNDYAVEVMRQILRTEKNLHSRYKPIELIIELIKDHPMLATRVSDLKRQTRDGQRIERYIAEIKALKKELKKERKKNIST
jgi:hypothetical protein